jgi:hypothetical protein
MVQGEGFEPPKAEPDDLQSPVFDRFTIPAYPCILPDFRVSERLLSASQTSEVFGERTIEIRRK